MGAWRQIGISRHSWQNMRHLRCRIAYETRGFMRQFSEPEAGMVYKARWDGENYRVWTKADVDRWVRAMWVNHDAAGYHYEQAGNERLSAGLREYHADRCSKTLAKMSRLIGAAKFNDEGMRRDFVRRIDGVLRMTDDDRFVMGDGPVGVVAEFGE